MPTGLAGRGKALRESDDIVGGAHRLDRLPQWTVFDTDHRDRPGRAPGTSFSDDVEQHTFGATQPTRETENQQAHGVQ